MQRTLRVLQYFQLYFLQTLIVLKLFINIKSSKIVQTRPCCWYNQLILKIYYNFHIIFNFMPILRNIPLYKILGVLFQLIKLSSSLPQCQALSKVLTLFISISTFLLIALLYHSVYFSPFLIQNLLYFINLLLQMNLKAFITFTLLSFLAYSDLIVISLNSYPNNWNLTVLTHLQDRGDVTGHEGQWVGTKGQSRRLEGFSISIDWPEDFSQPKPTLSYMAHVEDIGDMDYVKQGEFIGTRGKELRLQGFAIKLTGVAASFFEVRYKAHLQGKGDTEFFKNGQFCGTRKESRRVEAIYVNIVKIRPYWLH